MMCVPRVSLIRLQARQRLSNDRRGMAAVELALIGGIVITLLLVVFDMGLWIWQRMQLEGAMLAGVHYAQEFPEDGDGIASTVKAALPPAMVGAANVSSQISFSCPDGSTASTFGASTCPGSQQVFVQINATYPFSPLYFSAMTSNDLQYTIRVQ
jgi:Flp pilus assembly protein TadG